MLKRISMITLVLIVSLLWVTPSFAQDQITKLARGVGNLLTGVLEVPVQIMRETKNYGDFRGLFVGLFKGVFLGVKRTLIGAYEIVSFPFPIPKDYKPLMEPEFVIDGDALAF